MFTSEKRGNNNIFDENTKKRVHRDRPLKKHMASCLLAGKRAVSDN